MNESISTAENKRRAVGTVVSAKGDKTITVLTERRVRHPLYGKIVRKSSRLRAHDENNDCVEGDRVAIVATRPYSRTKFFRLDQIIERASERGKAASAGAAA